MCALRVRGPMNADDDCLPDDVPPAPAEGEATEKCEIKSNNEQRLMYEEEVAAQNASRMWRRANGGKMGRVD